MNEIIHGDCETVMSEFESDSIDLIVTDPPYGYGFMGKDWDKVVPRVEIWKGCFRVLKNGAFAFVMSSPRLDCLSQMAVRLSEAGFNIGFTPIYWTYASGFPKATNISKMVDKKLGLERKVIGVNPNKRPAQSEGFKVSETGTFKCNPETSYMLSAPVSNEAKVLDGSFAGFQPKPAVEVIIVAMKPLTEKTYVEQALKNGKGITWLDETRIPFTSESNPTEERYRYKINNSQMEKFVGYGDIGEKEIQTGGRFSANLLVSDDTLNDGRIQDSGMAIRHNSGGKTFGSDNPKPSLEDLGYLDSGSFSRYFDLDKWWEKKLSELPESVRKTFPFLIVEKASKGERNEGAERLEGKVWLNSSNQSGQMLPNKSLGLEPHIVKGNYHPTVKPLKLMSYLITLGSRKGDVVLDPFIGSGTTALAARILDRKYIGIELNAEYVKIAENRLLGTPFLNPF